MPSANLYRWSGLALIVGGIIGILISVVSTILFPGNSLPQPNQMTVWTIVWTVSLIGNMLLLAGVPAIAVRQAQAGAGLLGYALTFCGGVLLTAFGVIPLVAIPWLAQVAGNGTIPEPPPHLFILVLVATLVFGVGGLLLGLSIMRGGVLPRAAGALFLAGAVLNAVAFALNGVPSSIVSLVASILFNLALAWIGYVLVQETRAAVAQVRVANS